MSQTDYEKLAWVRERITATDPLYIIFTSGSGGTPKGVATSHLSLINYIEAYSKVLEINPSDRLACQSPLDYIAAIRDIYLPLSKGAYSYLLPKQLFMEPDMLFQALNEKEISCVGWSASAITVLTKLGAFKDMSLKTLRKVCFSGSVMPSSVLSLWQENLPDTLFINQYGPTETTASCTYYRIDHRVSKDEILPIGEPFDNYKVFLISESDSAVPDGELGEICVSGIGLSLGYYRDQKRTEAAFTMNPLNRNYPERIYRTGDIGRFREDGLLEYHGRRDRQIKHMGHRVELDEIEAAAMQMGNIDECACLYDSESETILLIYSGKAEIRDISIFLRGILPGFMIPRKIRKQNALPKLPNGKINIQSLKEKNL